MKVGQIKWNGKSILLSYIVCELIYNNTMAPKIKFLMWKFMNEWILPDASTLLDRKLDVNPTCCIFGHPREDPNHVFFCEVSKKIWNQVNQQVLDVLRGFHDCFEVWRFVFRIASRLDNLCLHVVWCVGHDTNLRGSHYSFEV